MSFESLMQDVVSILTRTVSSPGTTDLTNTYAVSKSGVRCRLEPLSAGRDRTVLGKYPSATHKMYCKVVETISSGDRVTDSSSNTYEVVAVENFFNHHLEIVLEKQPI